MAVAEAIKKLDSSQEIEKFKKNMEDSKNNYCWENYKRMDCICLKRIRAEHHLIEDVIITIHMLMIHIIDDHLFQLSRTPSMISTKIMHWNIEMIASI